MLKLYNLKRQMHTNAFNYAIFPLPFVRFSSLGLAVRDATNPAAAGNRPAQAAKGNVLT